jgi:hypothetical protein
VTKFGTEWGTVIGDLPLKATFNDSEMRSIDFASLTKSNSNSPKAYISKEPRTHENVKEFKPVLRAHQGWRLDQIAHRIVVRSWQTLFGSGYQSSSTHVLQGAAPVHHTKRSQSK